jgi:hypothetical protein
VNRTTHYTRWRRDHAGRLVLRQESYRVIGRSHVVERGLALRDAAMVTLTAAIWFFAVLCIALSTQGCASADGSPPPPEEPSPEAQPDSLPVCINLACPEKE